MAKAAECLCSNLHLDQQPRDSTAGGKHATCATDRPEPFNAKNRSDNNNTNPGPSGIHISCQLGDAHGCQSLTITPINRRHESAIPAEQLWQRRQNASARTCIWTNNHGTRQPGEKHATCATDRLEPFNAKNRSDNTNPEPSGIHISCQLGHAHGCHSLTITPINRRHESAIQAEQLWQRQQNASARITCIWTNIHGTRQPGEKHVTCATDCLESFTPKNRSDNNMNPEPSGIHSSCQLTQMFKLERNRKYKLLMFCRGENSQTSQINNPVEKTMAASIQL